MAFKVLIGRAPKGGTTAQQSAQVENAAYHLEAQLNDPDNKVQEVVSLFSHDVNPDHAEIIAFVKTADASLMSAKKGA
jgi:hypothetical protein